MALPNARTENDAPSYSTTGNKLVDLFFKLIRGFHEKSSAPSLVLEAFEEDPLKTMKIIFHARDCRGGKGEREAFYKALEIVHEYNPHWVEHNIALVPYYGYWLDLVRLLTYISDPEFKMKVQDIVANQLQHDAQADNPSLLAKWIPGEGHKWEKRTGILKDVGKHIYGNSDTIQKAQMLKKIRKEYLSPLRKKIDIPERHMCLQDWEGIKLSDIPSKALTKYRKALKRHLPEAYNQWLENVRQGKADIKAKQNYPHELVKTVFDGTYDETIEQQWKKLSEQYKGNANLNDAIVLSDVSGSMSGKPLLVSIAIGILIAENTSEPYNNSVITFSQNPNFHRMKGQTLDEKVWSLNGMNWGGNTDILAVFDRILERALYKNLPADELPSRLVILSDMQFDAAASGKSKDLNTTLDTIEQKYRDSGYRMPQIIFWNLRTDTKDFPVRKTERGIALISGYSPELLIAFLSSDEMTPETILNQIIESERYSFIEAPP